MEAAGIEPAQCSLPSASSHPPSPISNIARRRWPAHGRRQTIADEALTEMLARPVTMRCAFCGAAEECSTLDDGKAWFVLHDCAA